MRNHIIVVNHGILTKQESNVGELRRMEKLLGQNLQLRACGEQGEEIKVKKHRDQVQTVWLLIFFFLIRIKLLVSQLRGEVYIIYLDIEALDWR